MSAADRDYALALAFARGVGPATYRERLARYGSPASAFRSTVAGRDAADALQQAEHLTRGVARAGATLLVLGDADFPVLLHDLADPPSYVVATGDLALLARPAVAVVGTREPTAYGQRVAARISALVGEHGAAVVSGMARGIDAVAHRAALLTRGGTIAVVGGGVDVPYPAMHRELLGQLRTHGLILSEAPCGAKPGPGAFPKRNRIIAALARLTVVVEAGYRSGALITASHAAELGRAVGAVPGPIDAPTSAGSNALIRDGALLLTEERDVLQMAGLTTSRESGPATGKSSAIADAELDAAQLAVVRVLGDTPLGFDHLVERSGLGAREALTVLTALEVLGAVEQSAGGFALVDRRPTAADPAPVRFRA